MAHPDLNALKNALLPIAKQMLSEHGEFFPSGAAMKVDGKIVNCSGLEAGDEHPASQAVIDTLTENFRELACRGEIRAAAICCDVRVATPGQPDRVDAVQFALEHANGESIDVFLPYDLDSSNAVQWGQMFATRRDQRFFVNG